MTDYRVHDRHNTSVPVEAVMKDGTKVHGMLDTAIIELVPVDGVGPSRVVHRRIDTNEAKVAVTALFQRGAIVRASEYTLIKAPEAE